MFKWIREAIRERRVRKFAEPEIKKLAQRCEDEIEKINRRNLDSQEGTLVDRLRAAHEEAKPIREYRDSVNQAILCDRLERAGIETPERLLSSTEFLGRKLLNDAGKHWARVELRRYGQQQIEFWAKLIFPILSLIMSIIALVVSIHKH